MTRGVEDHVEYMAVEMSLGRQHALEVSHRIGDLGLPEKRGGGEGWSSPVRRCNDWMGEHPCLFSCGTTIEEWKGV